MVRLSVAEPQWVEPRYQLPSLSISPWETHQITNKRMPEAWRNRQRRNLLIVIVSLYPRAKLTHQLLVAQWSLAQSDETAKLYYWGQALMCACAFLRLGRASNVRRIRCLWLVIFGIMDNGATLIFTVYTGDSGKTSKWVTTLICLTCKHLRLHLRFSVRSQAICHHFGLQEPLHNIHHLPATVVICVAVNNTPTTSCKMASSDGNHEAHQVLLKSHPMGKKSCTEAFRVLVVAYGDQAMFKASAYSSKQLRRVETLSGCKKVCMGIMPLPALQRW